VHSDGAKGWPSPTGQAGWSSDASDAGGVCHDDHTVNIASPVKGQSGHCQSGLGFTNCSGSTQNNGHRQPRQGSVGPSPASTRLTTWHDVLVADRSICQTSAVTPAHMVVWGAGKEPRWWCTCHGSAARVDSNPVGMRRPVRCVPGLPVYLSQKTIGRLIACSVPAGW
jgi:hypothetical protein